MIDNLAEAIAHAREVASKQRRRFEDIYCQEEQTEAERKEAIACLDCSNEHGQLVAWLEELQTRREADKWISVNDKLPEKEGRCLVLTDYGDVTMDSYIDGMFVCNLGNVTHWKPLPKPYESEADK